MGWSKLNWTWTEVSDLGEESGGIWMDFNGMDGVKGKRVEGLSQAANIIMDANGAWTLFVPCILPSR